MVDCAPAVIVNAASVASDAARYLAPFPAEIVSLPFGAAAPAAWFDTDPEAVRKSYAIGRRWFIVSNQFWVHKRHDVAVTAFVALASRYDDVDLVCTGAIEDARAPDYFSNLAAVVNKAGLERRVHFLGLIPKLDQVALLRGAIAVVQPTGFEGGPGGGSVFDAVALVLRTIVSDIPVNREISDVVTCFVPLGDADALEAVMEDMLGLPPPDREVADLRRAGDERRLAMGAAVARAARHAHRRSGICTSA